MCRQGASVIQRDVLSKIDDPALRAYVAWLPILIDDSEEAARESASLVPDARAAHFWDATKALPPSFASLLRLPEGMPAWDLYLGYAPGADWLSPPAFWHHQLGDDLDAPTLDGPAFAAGVRDMLAS